MALKEVSIWSDAKKREEVDRFDLAMIQHILNDILVMNHKLFGTKGGLALKAPVFIYENILNVAREVWTKPFLLYHRVNKQEYQKNMLALEKLIIGEIKSTVRRMNKMADAGTTLALAPVPEPDAPTDPEPEPAPDAATDLAPEAEPDAATDPAPEAEPAPDTTTATDNSDPQQPQPIDLKDVATPRDSNESNDFKDSEDSNDVEELELASNSDSKEEEDCKDLEEPMAIRDLKDLNDLKYSRQSIDSDTDLTSKEPEKAILKNKKVKSSRILRQMYLDPYLYTPQKTLRKHLKKKK